MPRTSRKLVLDRLDVAKRTTNDTPIQITIRDAIGAKIATTFWQNRPAGGRSGGASVVTGMPAHSDPPLPPGRYTLTLTAPGYRACTVDAEIQAGKTLDVEARLEPE